MASPLITRLRDFPQVEELLQLPELADTISALPRPIAVEAVRQTVADCKARLQQTGTALSRNDLHELIRRSLLKLKRRESTRVINAAGIVVHTNLGRAPLSPELFETLAQELSGYTNLEFDLASGLRGHRGEACEHYLALLAEAESAAVVNNCAAALFIILNTLANRKKVIISRGELVQIGGGFRIPDILQRAGGKLIEVGTTNVTGLDDYEKAIDNKVALILKVHQSNFVQEGFTGSVPLSDLVSLGRKHSLPVINDLGSGVFVSTRELLGYDEPTVQQSVRAGADLTCFSADKLLGGVQAGLIVGRVELIEKLKRNPLFRALRADKVVFAVLERLFRQYLDGTWNDKIPLWQMLSVPVSDLYSVAQQMLKQLGSPEGISVAATQAYVGGGALPESDIPSVGIIFSAKFKSQTLLKAFRDLEPPVIGRIENDQFLLDLKAILPQERPLLLDGIRRVLSVTSS